MPKKRAFDAVQLQRSIRNQMLETHRRQTLTNFAGAIQKDARKGLLWVWFEGLKALPK
jgi:hypothetical protein